MPEPLTFLAHIARVQRIQSAEGLATDRGVARSGFKEYVRGGRKRSGLVGRYVKIGPEPGHIYPDRFSLHIPPEDMNNRTIGCPAVLDLVDRDPDSGEVFGRAGHTHAGIRPG